MHARIDRGSSVPESEQLRLRLATLIERGTLGPGERLPPVRALAEQLGLAVNTVAKAYRELEGAGALVARGRLGTFVVDTLPARPPAAEVRLAEARRDLRPSSTAAGFRAIRGARAGTSCA